MGRPRKDDQPSVPPLRIGRQRTLPHGGTYRVRAYAPTPGAANGRVSWRYPDTGKQTSSVPREGQSLDDLFDFIEKALDQRVALGPTRDEEGQSTRRDIGALGLLYLDWLTTLGGCWS